MSARGRKGAAPKRPGGTCGKPSKPAEGPRGETLEATAHVQNTSAQPVYNVRLRWHSESDLSTWGGNAQQLTPLMPGEEVSATYFAPLDADLPTVITATFRDRAGAWWQTRPDGDLEEASDLPPNLSIGQPGMGLTTAERAELEEWSP